MKEDLGGYLSEFMINGKQYIVSRKLVSKKMVSRPGKKDEDTEPRVVGELIIKDNSYAVIQESDEQDSMEITHKDSAFETLTSRELQIVMLVARGKANKQIAAQLKISEWTVSTHLRRIFAKLGVSSRAAMVYQCSQFINNKPDI